MTLPQQISADSTGNHQLQLREETLSPPLPRPALSLKDVVAMIYRRRLLTISLFSAIFLIVVAATIMQPSIYMIRAKLLFKKERANTVVSASEGAAAEDKVQLSEEALNSEIEILKSTTLLREVLRSNMLYKQIIGAEKAGSMDSTEAIEFAVALFKVDMDCQIVPKSNILQVSYESKDPRLATEVINELCQRYVDRHLEVHESKGIYSFFQKQAEVLRDTLQVMSAMLEEFEAEHDLVAPEQQRQLYLQKLAEYEVQLNTLRANSRAAGQQVDFLEKRIAAEPTRLQTQNQQVSSSVVEGLTEELASLKSKYAEVVRGERNRSEPRGQMARSLKARIAKIEETIQQHERTQQPEVSTDINQSMMDLSADLTRARFDLIGYQTKEKELRTAVAELRRDLKNLERASFIHEAMVRQIQLVQNNYSLYAKKREEARISEALDREKVANVSIIDPASVPLSPVSPNRKLNIAMGFFLALFISMATAFGVSFFDSVVHSSGDIERQLEVPVIVSIPDGEWPPNLLPEPVFETGGLPAELK
jgi:uncharacterized protein involved in exopolysaccharide biosynthesis